MTDARTPLDLFWYLPTHGDGPYLGTDERHRPASFGYLRDIAQAADRVGFKGVLLPTGSRCEDAWITAAALLPFTERLRFLVALRPGSGSPALFARHTAALDRISNGRVLLNVVVGADPADLAGDGIFIGHDERYAQADEFLTVWRAILAGEAVDFAGRYLSAKGAELSFPPVQRPYPPVWFGGSSDAGIEVAAKHVDVYLSWGEPVDLLAEKLDRVRRKAAEQGRSVRFGLRIHLIVRETEAEAWAAADRLISRVTDDLVASAQKDFRESSQSVGQTGTSS
jgi:alkanesulfonate monooxygenase